MSDHIKRYVDVEPERQTVKLPSDFTLLTLASQTDPDVKGVLRYVLARGLSERDLWYYKLGVSDEPRWRRRVLVPSFDALGNLNYFVGRAIDRQRKPKYDNSDCDKLPIVFNELNVDWSKRLILCEGVFDMFKCGDNAVPLLGSSLNENSRLFNEVIANETPVAIALDADMYHKRVFPIAAKLSEYNIDVVVVDIRPYSDPGSMTKAQFVERLNEARPYSWFDSFENKLSSVARTSLRL